MKDNKFLQWLKRPHGFLLALVYVVTVLSAVAAIVVSIVPTESVVVEMLSYLLYAIAAISLGYTVYTLVLYGPSLKSNVTSWLKKNKLVANVMENYGFSTLFFSVVSVAITLAFAVMNLVSAFKYRLLWYAAISAYYVLIILLRGGIVAADVKCGKKYAANSNTLNRRRVQIYLGCGVALIVLELAMGVAVTEMVLSRRPIQSGQIMTIANAAYTFYKLTMALLNLLKARRQCNPTVQALRNVNFADACMSMVSLTVIMLATFGGTENLMVIKALSGFAACAVTLALAVYMTVKGTKQLKNTKGDVVDE